MIPPESDDLDEFGLGFEKRGDPSPTSAPAAQDDDDDLKLRRLGEALRGLQDAQADQTTLDRLHGKLGKFAHDRFQQHAPVAKTLRSPYKDSTQIGIQCTGAFAPSAWAGGKVPQITGVSRIYQSFKPMKIIMSEMLVVTFTSGSRVETVAMVVDDASDLILTQLSAGSVTCFPGGSSGIQARTLSQNTLGGGISFPTFPAMVDVSATIAIEQTALYRASPPKGFTTSDITSIEARVDLALCGPALR